MAERILKYFPKAPYRRYRIKLHLPKIPWGDKGKNIVELIERCRISEGIPILKTEYGRIPFEVNGEKVALYSCWGGYNTGSWVITKIPNEDYEMLKERFGDWRWIVIKYAPEKYVRLVRLPVVI